ncbi:MAG: hypothetical protein R3C68_05530 [Myxococcota bacterium]
MNDVVGRVMVLLGGQGDPQNVTCDLKASLLVALRPGQLEQVILA